MNVIHCGLLNVIHRKGRSDDRSDKITSLSKQIEIELSSQKFLTPCGIDSIHIILSIPNILTQWIRPLFESKVLIRKPSIPVCWFQRSELHPNVYIRNVRNWIVCPAGYLCSVQCILWTFFRFPKYWLTCVNNVCNSKYRIFLLNSNFSKPLRIFFRNFPLGNGRRAWPRTT